MSPGLLVTELRIFSVFSTPEVFPRKAGVDCEDPEDCRSLEDRVG